jgi:nucleotide-binding universal stress UspA family protein
MEPIRRILCPVDFSAPSTEALSYAAGLARTLGAELHVLHVYELPMYTMPDGGLLAGPDLVARIEKEAGEMLENAVREHQDADLPVTTHLAEGIAHTVIVRHARELDVQLLVLGTHGRTGVMHALLGSVTERVLRTTDIPTLTIRASDS